MSSNGETPVCPICEYPIAEPVAAPCPECGATIIEAGRRPLPSGDWTLWLAAVSTALPAVPVIGFIIALGWAGAFAGLEFLAFALMILAATPCSLVWLGLFRRRRKTAEIACLLVVLMAIGVAGATLLIAVLSMGTLFFPGLLLIAVVSGGAFGAIVISTAMKAWARCEGRAKPAQGSGFKLRLSR